MIPTSYVSLFSLLALVACSSAPSVRQPGAVVQDPLALSRVELYRNGVGYFERAGKVEGNAITLKVRKDQVNDLLKSLTVIDKSTGRALSVTLPLDPLSWQNAAQADFTQGSAGVAPILQTLRGTSVVVRYGGVGTVAQEAKGRIAMVQGNSGVMQLGLLDGETLRLVPLDQLTSLQLVGGDVALQLHSNLDAAMGEGMFQQVDVTVRLNEAPTHDVQLSYVVEAPKWKPTYRLVLDSRDSSKALLQSWAVVDNTSGESWNNVKLNLTSGAPIAFKYNLHAPQNVTRPDMTQNQTDKQVDVAIVASSNTAKMPPAPARPAAARMGRAKESDLKNTVVEGFLENPSVSYVLQDESNLGGEIPDDANAEDREFFEAQAQATQPLVASNHVSGLTQYQLQEPVTLPNGTASMVALISQKVPGNEFFLYNPGGAGKGYYYNPYRVVRFRNQTPFALEPGPLSIYNNGHFVGEGITDAVGAMAVTTIPFAVESGITVQSQTTSRTGEHILMRMVRGVLYTKTVKRWETNWTVRGPLDGMGYMVMIKHGKQGGLYELKSQHPGFEESPKHWLIPVTVASGQDSASVTVLEEAPGIEEISFWNYQAMPLLKACLLSNKLSPVTLKALQPVVDKRQEMDDIAGKVRTLQEQQNQYDSRLRELRGNLDAISKDKKAGSLRDKLSKDLLEFTEKSNALGRQIVELKDRELVLKIELQDLIKDLNLNDL